MAQFSEGQKVRAMASTQGMAMGREYEVVAVAEARTAFGVFTTYELRGVDGRVVVVRNGHLVLKAA